MENRIKELREKNGYTQQEVADSLNLESRSTVCRMESGKIDISFETAIKLANLFNVSLDELIVKK